MKKILALVIGLGVASGAFAQSFGSRLADVDLEWELGESPFCVAPVSYVYFGFNSLINAESDFKAHTGFFRTQQLGANIVEVAVKPFEGGRFSLGADITANWYRLNNDYMWVPYIYAFRGFTGRGENGFFVRYESKAENGIQEVKKSLLTVCTFSVPVNFSYSFGSINTMLGASLEVNLNGIVQFKGVDNQGNNIVETHSGNRFSKKIGTNRIGFNVHAALSYGGLGLYVQYSPIPKFYKYYDAESKQDAICGPQFQTLSVGIIWGLGM
jgi:hypothetical protein